MLSEEAQIGVRMRVREGTRRRPSPPELVGTIEKRWGEPTYIALDVLLDDGSRQLFWHHELEEVAGDGGGARRPARGHGS